jgi:flagellar biosynthesis/type III secretory pathway protein FliH
MLNTKGLVKKIADKVIEQIIEESDEIIETVIDKLLEESDEFMDRVSDKLLEKLMESFGLDDDED